MKKLNLIILILSFVLISLIYGCSGENIDLSQVSEEDVNKVVVCPDNYIRFGSSCCLDINKNKICDNDESLVNDTDTEENSDEEEVSCSDECSDDSCSGKEYISCLKQTDGCKDEVNKGKIISKCNVECLTSSDCSSNQKCDNYECITESSNEIILTIDNIDSIAKGEDYARITSVQFTINNKGKDFIPKVEAFLTSNEMDIKDITLTELKAGETVTKTESKLTFGFNSIGQEHTLKLNVYDEQNKLIATASKNFKVGENGSGQIIEGTLTDNQVKEFNLGKKTYEIAVKDISFGQVEIMINGMSVVLTNLNPKFTLADLTEIKLKEILSDSFTFELIAPDSQEIIISIDNFQATPENIIINTGNIVTWKNIMNDYKQIIVIYPFIISEGIYSNEPINSINEIWTGEEYSYTFDKSGKYKWGSKTKFDRIQGIITVI